MEARDPIVRCPTCGADETRVIDSRDQDDGATIRRRRECVACEARFTTFERVEAARLTVVKRDGSRVEFDHDRLAAGLAKALTRRPVPSDAAESAADSIEAELRASGASELPSSRIGELAMDRLRALDQIAYIRFASVYQSYEDIEQLKREVDTLLAERATPGETGAVAAAAPSKRG
ncbi:MAG: transcriptional regulator NrdR [Candidatus Limnocylindrales bacterium]